MVTNLVVTQEGVVLGDYLDPTLLAMLGSTVIPLLVSLVLKAGVADWVKAVTNIIATGLLAVAALWINPGDAPITWQLVIFTLLTSFITSFSTYKGIWKPVGATAAIELKTGEFGIGTPVQPVDLPENG
ncbi:MAG TPA: hypothetical protein VIY48_12580 [Candidatus Paceibacterota bacterium]